MSGGRHLKTAPNPVRCYEHVVRVQRAEGAFHVVRLVLGGGAQRHSLVAGEGDPEFVGNEFELLLYLCIV